MYGIEAMAVNLEENLLALMFVLCFNINYEIVTL